jgi:hypothetical protein
MSEAGRESVFESLGTPRCVYHNIRILEPDRDWLAYEGV